MTLIFGYAFSQSIALKKIDFIIGEWSGTGDGFGNKQSKINSSFTWVMNKKYIEVKNVSQFEPDEENPEGEYHEDRGYISYDNTRRKIVFRQFNIETYVNQYVLNDSLSKDDVLVFETEGQIENFVSNGKARWIIKKTSDHQLETVFEASFTGKEKEYACFGTNYLTKGEVPKENIPRVTGVGGIFFFSNNPVKLKEWYNENLGLQTNEWGSSFEFRNANHPDEINYLQWSPFKKNSNYFSPSEKEFMINYRVHNIEELVEKLKNKGITIVDEMTTYEYGKFIHIMDPEGNKIELWEPVDHILTEMGGKTTK